MQAPPPPISLGGLASLSRGLQTPRRVSSTRPYGRPCGRLSPQIALRLPRLLVVGIVLLASSALPSSGCEAVVADAVDSAGEAALPPEAGGKQAEGQSSRNSAPDAERSNQPDEALRPLVERILARHDRLRSLAATVRSRNLAADYNTHSIVKAWGDRRFYERWHGPPSARNTDPGRLLRYYDTERFDVFSGFTRDLETTRRFAVRPYIDKILPHPIYEAIGWWPPDSNLPPIRRDNGESLYLVDLLRDSRLRRDDTDSIVDGVRCDVLAVPGVSTLWFDAEGSRLIRHDVFRAPATEALSPGTTATLTARFEMGDFRPVDATPITLPFRFTRWFPETKVRTRHDILSYRVNSLGKSDFLFDPPPGTLILDRDTDTRRQIPGWPEGLEAAAELVVELSSGPDDERDRQTLAAPATLIAGGFGAILGLLSGPLIRDGIPRRSRSPVPPNESRQDAGPTKAEPTKERLTAATATRTPVPESKADSRSG